MDLDRYYELRTLLYAWKSRLAENLRRQAEASPQALRRLRSLYDQEGSSEPFSDWLSLWCRQAAIQWILRVLFLRVLEDRGLLGVVRIRTSDGRLMWKQLARNLGASSYLLWCCRDAAHLLPDLFGPTEFDFLLPNDDLMQRFFDDVWRRPDSNREGWLRFDFRPDPDKADEGFQTRFIGDLYQELDSEIRERHALLQTPDFISQFILKYTLLKRFDEKDFRTVTMIDLTCGSGHFIVDGFWAYVSRYEQALGRGREQLSVQERVRIARRVIEEHLFGCDINPYATALARFRLILAACDYARPASLQELRDLRINIVTIDSLIPYEKIMRDGVWGGEGTTKILGRPDDIQHALPILQKRYDIVVGNPPYILPSEEKKNTLYRKYYRAAFLKYGLSAPFIERFLDMTLDGGKIGVISSNAFGRRQFGKKLIEDILPLYDLETIVDLSGIEVPGHGTPTLILFVHKNHPQQDEIKIISSIRRESEPPRDPSLGKAWNEITQYYSEDEYIGTYVAISKQPRSKFNLHPWNFHLREERLVEKFSLVSEKRLKDFTSLLGTSVITGQDELYSNEPDVIRRTRISTEFLRHFIFGSDVRDWITTPSQILIFPYLREEFVPVEIEESPYLRKFFNPFRGMLEKRTSLSGQSKWFELCRMKYATHEDKRAIGGVLVSTHNHFVYDESGMLFQQGVPAIKLSEEYANFYLPIVGILNSSSACLFYKQVCFDKRAGKDEIRDTYYEFAAVNVGKLPIPRSLVSNPPLRNQVHGLVSNILLLARNLRIISTIGGK